MKYNDQGMFIKYKKYPLITLVEGSLVYKWLWAEDSNDVFKNGDKHNYNQILVFYHKCL